MSQSNKSKLNGLLSILLVFSFLSVLWLLGDGNSIVDRDISTLYAARFNTFKELIHLKDINFHGGGPVGLIVIKSLYVLFGENYQSFHIILIIFHFFNIYFIYKIASLIFNRIDNEIIKYTSILASAFFGIYPIYLISGSLITGVYNIISCLFILLSVYFYLIADRRDKYKDFYTCISILFFLIAIYTNVVALILPFILLMYEILISTSYKRKLEINKNLLIQILVMCTFILLLYRQNNNLYILSSVNINPVIIIKNTIVYIFNRDVLLNVLCVIIFIFSFFLVLKDNDFSLLLSIFCIGINVVVLSVLNMLSNEYMYIPYVFICFSLSLFIYKLLKYIKCKYLWEIVLAFLLCIYIMNYYPKTINLRGILLETRRNTSYKLEQIKKLDKPIEETTIYLKGDNNYRYSWIGEAINLIYNDQTITTILVEDFPKNPLKPYMLIEDYNGSIKEVSRDMTVKALVINSVYPEYINDSVYLNEDGSLNFAVVSNVMNENIKIVVNNILLETTLGKEFISAIIPEELLKLENIEIKIKDVKTNRTSEGFIININLN